MRSVKKLFCTQSLLRKITIGVVLFFCTGTCFLNAQDVMKVQNGAVITVQNGADMVLLGGISLDNGSILNNNGTIWLKQNGVSGAADWKDNTVAGYNHGTGTVVFNGSGGHILNSKNIFERINVDASGHITLASDINTNKLYLINGKVNTTLSFKTIILNTTQLAVQADAANTNFSNSWLNGNLRRYISPATVNNYIFPVGNATRVNRAEIDNLTNTPLTNLSYIDASFGPKPGSDAGLMATESGQSYVTVSNDGVWYLTPDIQPSSGKYDVLLYLNGFSGLSDNAFAIIKRPDASSNAADWTVPAGSLLPANNQPGRLVSSGYARRNNIGSFSQYGIGNFLYALPVTLLSFDANRLSKLKVQVKWQTVTEINNLGFDVERRLDGETAFSKIGFTPTLAPNGNSNSALNYNFTDANGFAGISYYRLKQIDWDSRFVYTHIKAVKGVGDTQVSVLLYPNPNYGQFTIRLDGVIGTFDAFVSDINGKVVRQLKLTKNSNISITGLSAGTYIIRIPEVFGHGESFSEKILVIK